MDKDGRMSRREAIFGIVATMLLPGCATQPATKPEIAARILPGQKLKFENLDFEALPKEIPFSGRVVLVLRDKQVLGYYKEGKLVLQTGVSTGMPGHATPIGEHTIREKSIDYFSKKYQVPMPYAQKIADTGEYLHQSGNVGPGQHKDEDGNFHRTDMIRRTFNSHGCIGLSEKDAKFFWNELEVGDLVIVR